MKTLIICIVLALFSPSVSKAVKLEDQTLDQQVEPRPMWPSFTDHSYIYLLGLFVNQRVSIFKHFFTGAEPAMFRAAIILSQKLNKTANGKQFAYRIEHTSGRDVIETLDLTCHAILENEILGIVGPEYSSEAKTLSRFANRAGLPVIGYSTTDPELSNRHAYQTFYRLPPSDVITVYALLKLFQKYNWNSTNVIYQSDNYGEGGLRALTEVFNKKINISRKIKYDLSTDEIDDLQQQLEKSPSRIVVVWASVNVTTQIIQEALRAGNILAPRFLWILMSPNTTMLTADNQDVNQLSGMLMLRLVTSNLFDISIDTELLNNATDIWKEYDPESYPVDEKRIDTFALYAFDAAWLLILAIEKLCQQNPTTCLSYENSSSCFTSQLVNHEDLNKIIQTMNFTGVSGYVQFQSNTTDRVGSTMADYIIDNLQPLTKDSNKLQIVEVLRLNGTIMDIERDNEPQWEELDATISWPSHSPEPPTDYARLRGKLYGFRVS
jgi:ABC-type branched-subunit amino acid transport system substrate-binding protein